MEKVVFMGVKDLEYGQRGKVERLGARVGWGGVGEGGGGTCRDYVRDLDKVLRDGGDDDDGRECSVHIEFDCLDTGIGIAIGYAAARSLRGED